MTDLYFLDVRGGRVGRLDLEAETVVDVVTGLREVPDGVAVHPAEGRVYWTNMGTPDHPVEPGVERPFGNRNGSIQSAALDGSDVRTVLPQGAFTTGKQLALDVERGLLYWCDREGRGIWCAGTEGSGLTRLLDTSGSAGGTIDEMPVGIAIDTERRLLYWTQKGPAKGDRGRIFRAPLDLPEGVDPARRDEVEVLWHGLPEPIDLHLTADGSRLYWTDRGALPQGNSLNTAAVPGRGEPAAQHTVLATGFDEAIGLALDERAGVAYVSDLGGSIRAVDLADGSVRELLHAAGCFTGITLAAALDAAHKNSVARTDVRRPAHQGEGR
jgi:DNA-binding beta-propeller fold protein YncE